MSRAAAAREHAWPFLRYWCRPMSGAQAIFLVIIVFFSALLCVMGGGWALIPVAWFSFLTTAWTWASVLNYRESLREKPDGGDRFRVIDGRTTFRRRWR